MSIDVDSHLRYLFVVRLLGFWGKSFAGAGISTAAGIGDYASKATDQQLLTSLPGRLNKPRNTCHR
eukprot:2645523-Amphidinium_carterae.1